MAEVAAPLAHHQSVRRAKAAGSALRRKWLIEHEVRTHGKSVLDTGSVADNGKCNSALIGWGFANLPQHVLAATAVFAIYDDGVEFAFGQSVQRRLQDGGTLMVHAALVQHSSHDPHGRYILREQQCREHEAVI